MAKLAVQTKSQFIAAGQHTLSEIINNEYKLARESVGDAIQHALNCGTFLLEQKEVLPHGQFQKWIVDNCDFSPRHARRFIELAKKTDTRGRFESLRKALGYDKPAHVSHSSGENEWYTPPGFIDSVHAVMGGIDLDPASSKSANQVVRATRYFTKAEDGLSKKWTGRIFMNPPYASNLVKKFTEKFISSDIAEGVVLVNNATETVWFQMLAAKAEAVCLVGGRISYLNEEMKSVNTPLQGQVFLYFGANISDFIKEFRAHGLVFKHG